MWCYCHISCTVLPAVAGLHQWPSSCVQPRGWCAHHRGHLSCIWCVCSVACERIVLDVDSVLVWGVAVCYMKEFDICWSEESMYSAVRCCWGGRVLRESQLFGDLQLCLWWCALLHTVTSAGFGAYTVHGSTLTNAFITRCICASHAVQVI